MRWSKNRLALVLTAFALVAAFGTACAPQTEEPTTPTETEEPTGALSYGADLAPAEGVETTAAGSSTVDVEGGSATFSVTVEELSNINMAHIHIAEEPGGSGPPAVWLYPADGQAPQLREGVTSGELSSGTFDASQFVGPLEGMTMDDLLTAIDEGRAYVNVHTEAYPDGEISGVLQQ